MPHPRPLRILITNIGIVNRTGTEIVAMDLAAGLARLGHFPMIWTPLLDPGVAAHVQAAGIPVVSRFDDLPCIPDIIHGHHHLETIEALRRFPGVPAIFVCHSGYSWNDAPPRHRAIRCFVGVDDFCRERLNGTVWIRGGDVPVKVVWNAVDLDRHRPRQQLPQRPRRALIFSHYAGPDTHVEPIWEACRQTGLNPEIVGSAAGNPSTQPERLLPDYDLVFAKARCAMEAMATGCAVILCDTSGLGVMVTSAGIGELRRWNFGFRVLQRPFYPELITKEIRRYDPRDAGEVSAYLRQHASLDRAVEQYLALYREALDKPEPVSDDIDWHPATRPLQIEDQAALRLQFLTVPESAAPRSHFTFEIALYNGSSVPIATSAPWPCLLMYRWLNGRTGELAVEHGFRSIIQPPAWPGEESVYCVRGIAPSDAGEYILRLTIIQEGWRWLDLLPPAVSVETPMTITSGSLELLSPRG